MSLRTIFETCRPRADVEAGTTKDEQFAADLAQVVNQTAPKEYADPAVFFRHSYPTRGMRELLKAVLTRLSGRGGEIASIIRLRYPVRRRQDPQPDRPGACRPRDERGSRGSRSS